MVRHGVVDGRVELAAVPARPDAGRGRSRENPGMPTEVLRYAAFTTTPDGGNPAGVVLDAAGLDEAAMQAIAAEVGYSETAFVTAVASGDDAGSGDGADAGRGAGDDDADGGERRRHVAVRYFSPLAEVPFCGHATIATGVAMGDRGERSDLVFHTVAGLRVGVGHARRAAGRHPDERAPAHRSGGGRRPRRGAGRARLARGRPRPRPPARVAYAGARHLVLAAATRERLAALDYDMPRLGALMAARDWTTLQLIFRRGDDVRRTRPLPTRWRRRGPCDRRRGRGPGRVPARARAGHGAGPTSSFTRATTSAARASCGCTCPLRPARASRSPDTPSRSGRRCYRPAWPR